MIFTVFVIIRVFEDYVFYICHALIFLHLAVIKIFWIKNSMLTTK